MARFIPLAACAAALAVSAVGFDRGPLPRAMAAENPAAQGTQANTPRAVRKAALRPGSTRVAGAGVARAMAMDSRRRDARRPTMLVSRSAFRRSGQRRVMVATVNRGRDVRRTALRRSTTRFALRPATRTQFSFDLEVRPDAAPELSDDTPRGTALRWLAPDAGRMVAVGAGPAQHGRASYYASFFNGRLMANGQRFDPNSDSAAHRYLPFGTQVAVRNLANGRETIVTIRDRGPFVRGRIIDLSPSTARLLDMKHHGVVPVVAQPVQLRPVEEVAAAQD